MAEPPDDENDKDDEGKSGGKSQGSASGGGAKPGDATQTADDIAAKRKRTEGEGTGTGAATSGVVRAGADGKLPIDKLSVEKQKIVWANFRALDLNQAIIALAEFCNEFPSRASANMMVGWEKGNYAIVNMAIKFGQDVAMAVRERTRESSVSIRRKYGISIKAARRAGMAQAAANPSANPS